MTYTIGGNIMNNKNIQKWKINIMMRVNCGIYTPMKLKVGKTKCNSYLKDDRKICGVIKQVRYAANTNESDGIVEHLWDDFLSKRESL